MRHRPGRSLREVATAWLICLMMVGVAWSEPPRPVSDLQVEDYAWDDGTSLHVRFALSPDDVIPPAEESVGGVEPLSPVASYRILRSMEENGRYDEVGLYVVEEKDRQRGRVEFRVEKCVRNQPYWIRVVAVGRGEEHSESIPVTSTEAVKATRQWFHGKHFWLLIIVSTVCGSVILFVVLARQGRQLYIRKIAGLEAIEEAVGRATEMGRGCLFVPGLQDINDIQTIAGLTLLSRVAQLVAEYDAEIEVPTSRSLVMTAARETVEAAFLQAGRPDAYQRDSIYYVTDEQFGYVAQVTGFLVRQKPAACFYLGAFFAESLILAETGNSVGAIQVAGTAQPAQLPFFVAACDYTLIGEEFFAASAYLSNDPDQLGSLKGQDVGKILVGALIVVGVGLITLGNLPGLEFMQEWATYLKDQVLAPG